jgi:uronate dehydrogenase
MSVLITGAAGRLGRKLTRALERSHELVLGDVTPLADPRFVPLDVTDLEAVRAAVQGCDAIAHLAIADWPLGSFEDDLRHATRALQVHVAGTYNMLQAAWANGVRQFVHISSVSAVDGLPPEMPVTSDTRHYSNSLYGLTKGFGEDLCRAFHHSYGVPVAVLRIGTIYNPEPGGAWLGNIFHAAGNPLPLPSSSQVHVDDVTRAIELALEQSEGGYVVSHIVGAEAGGRWDLTAARDAYGWAPQYAFGADGLPVAR